VSAWRLRTGRKVGRTVYRQLGDEPSDADPLVGVMDTPELAARVVEAVNGLTGPGGFVRLTFLLNGGGLPFRVPMSEAFEMPDVERLLDALRRGHWQGVRIDG
jgi:hypothetical protein